MESQCDIYRRKSAWLCVSKCPFVSNQCYFQRNLLVLFCMSLENTFKRLPKATFHQFGKFWQFCFYYFSENEESKHSARWAPSSMMKANTHKGIQKSRKVFKRNESILSKIFLLALKVICCYLRKFRKYQNKGKEKNYPWSSHIEIIT